MLASLGISAYLGALRNNDLYFNTRLFLSQQKFLNFSRFFAVFLREFLCVFFKIFNLFFKIEVINFFRYN